MSSNKKNQSVRIDGLEITPDLVELLNHIRSKPFSQNVLTHNILTIMQYEHVKDAIDTDFIELLQDFNELLTYLEFAESDDDHVVITDKP